MRTPPVGFALVEVIIGILLTAVVVAAVLMVCLMAQGDYQRNDLRMQAQNSAANLLNQLQNYLTASYGYNNPSLSTDSTDQLAGPCNLSVCNQPGQTTWSLPNDPCSGCAAGRYALDTIGSHDATSFLPSNFKSLYNMTMTYTVKDLGKPPNAANSQYNVTVNIAWQSPKP